jgi:1-acyl-sn-glycerol-3-phosphate acyltransferase
MDAPVAPAETSGAPRSREDVVAARVLQLTAQLARELRPNLSVARIVLLDSDLERDLAFDSLARAELVLRLDRAFKIRLPDHLIGSAETPRDLAKAVIETKPAFDLSLDSVIHRDVLRRDVQEPLQAATLIEVLLTHVRSSPDRVHIRLWRGEQSEDLITYSDLDRASRAVAGGLIECGLRAGDRVGIMLPTEADFFSAFYGVLYAGGVPVPIYPPFRRSQIEDHLRRQAGILNNAEASVLITNEQARAAGKLLHGLVASLRGIVTIGELQQAPTLPTPVSATTETIALIQYTSGSTGDPKGVVLSHANLLANIRAIGAALQASDADVVVSWLPLYHDMGLIGCWLGALYYGALAVIMPPLAFLADPMRWLWALHRHQATITAAPNFAFELCVKAAADEPLRGLELGSLRAVMNGAEPVSPATIRRFTECFARHDFRPEVIKPVYGLAESSVGLAFPPLERGPITDRIDRLALSRDGAAVAAAPDDEKALEFVACGQPLPGHQIRIVDEDGREFPERREGRLQFKGPSATSGYFRNSEKTKALFDGEWLESGDRAYIASGDVFVTGRIKDMIKRAGRNIYPQELEDLIGGSPGVRKGCVAAFASPDPRTGTERLIVMAETRMTDPQGVDKLRQSIIEASRSLLDVAPEEVVLTPPHTVPKTSSGKIRRSAARALYESGLVRRGSWSLPLQILRLTLAGLVPRLHRAEDKVRTWAYAGWWWLMLGTAALALWPLVLMLPRRVWRHAALSWGARLFFRAVGSPITVTSDGPVPERSAILIVNHVSYLDGAVLAAACPGELTFVAKQNLMEQLFAGLFLRRIGTVFVRRTDPSGGVADARFASEVAQSGQRLVWFPEGTFTRMPGLLPFHMGAFQAACQAGVPVIPVAIGGTRSILRSDQWLPRRGAISVHTSMPLHPEGGDFTAAVRLRDATRAEILRHIDEPDLANERIRVG